MPERQEHAIVLQRKIPLCHLAQRCTSREIIAWGPQNVVVRRIIAKSGKLAPQQPSPATDPLSG